jgi:hypothetical protein
VLYSGEQKTTNRWQWVVQGLKCNLVNSCSLIFAGWFYLKTQMKWTVIQGLDYCPDRSWSMDERGPPWMPVGIRCDGCICPTFISNCASHLRVVGSSCNHPNTHEHKDLLKVLFWEENYASPAHQRAVERMWKNKFTAAKYSYWSRSKLNPHRHVAKNSHSH